MAQEQITTRLVMPDEVDRLQALMRRCYGETYFDSLYYDAGKLAAAIDDQKQYSMVAVNEAGEFVSHIAVRNFHNSLTADTSMAIVDPRYRSRGLFVDIGAQMLPIYQRLNLCGLYLQSVTVHPYTQQSSAKGNAGIVGLYLNYIPASTRFLEMDGFTSDVPTPSLILLQGLAPMPERDIVLPGRYREHILTALQQCDASRKQVGAQPLPTVTELRVEKKPRQRIAYLWVDRPGQDFAAQLDTLWANDEWMDYDAVYLQLPLNRYDVGDATESARAKGFVYAGVLPEFGGQDWLTLQHASVSESDFDHVHLISEHSQQLLRFILDDYA